MRPHAVFRRLALTTVAAGLTLTGLALPARAADDLELAYVGILGPETVTVVNGQSKTVRFDLYNLGAAAEDVVLTFGSAARPISADLGFTAPAGCEQNTCAIGDLKAGERRSVKFTLKPAAAGAADPAGNLALSTSVGGRASDETSITVVRTDKGGADLEVADLADLKLGPGESADVPVAIHNSGSKDVKALGLLVMAPLGVTPVLNYSNCEPDRELGGFVCVFNETLAAGGSFALPEATPLRVTVPMGTAGPYDYPVYVAAIGLADRYVFDFAKRTAGAAGRELELETVASVSAAEPEVADDLNKDDNAALFSVTVPKTNADSAAVGGVFSGAVGDSSTVKVGVRNLGPSATIPASVGWIQYAHVKLPAGVRLTRLDERCLPGTSPTDIDEDFANLPDDVGLVDGAGLPEGAGPSEGVDLSGITNLVCLVVESVPGNGRHLFSLSAEIVDAAEYKAGFVKVDGGVQDSKSGNDRAALTVELTAGGGGGGLPITGAPAGLVGAGGAVLLVMGVIAYRSARRRRIVTVVE
ncbi:hypothetical protein QLQ12_18690 [Actinoplanes sp. NEAU-A12]|uniref:Uncharacterized protein n=1 Tax=Actinoplanes sandaracinus TaxID=3045177 RepID=A0ABT6WLN7_9ACTN|nr:hypothetical protein [Actinoplanes sandaracinus]MDI6100639.1 hypothetical protein [Actinoplanes sandaracinus]